MGKLNLFQRLTKGIKNVVEKTLNVFRRKPKKIKFEATTKEIREYNRLSKKVDKQRKKLTKQIDKYAAEGYADVVEEDVRVKIRPAKNIPIEKHENRKGFERKLTAMRGYQSKDFFANRAATYKENLIIALNKIYGNSAVAEVVGLINQLTPEQLQWLLLRHPDDFSVDYIYIQEIIGEDILPHLKEQIEHALGLTNLTLGKK